MVFKAPAFTPPLPEVPDTVPLCEFMFDERYGRCPISKSLDPYTCGLTGQSISAEEQKVRVEYLARALAHEFAWNVNEGTEFDKVVGVFATNTVSDEIQRTHSSSTVYAMAVQCWKLIVSSISR